MADGWVSGLLRFFLVCTNFSPVEQGLGGWKEGRGGVGLGSDFHIALFRAEVTKSSHIESISHHKAKEKSS